MDTSSIGDAAVSPAMPSDRYTGHQLHGFALGSVLAALMLTLLLEALDQTIVGTALPQIIASLQGFDRYTWVATAYLLASTTMIPIVGKLSDQFGRKWFFVTGVIGFLVGSILCGAAQTMNQLIVFRAIQGLGAGMGIALVFTVVGDIFPPAERARWQGIFAAVYGFASVIGPTLGGWLTDHGPLLGTFVTAATRWRWIFYVNLPVGIVALLAVLIYLPSTISMRGTIAHGWAALRRVDGAGAVLASAATICLLLGLTWGGDQTYDWSSPQVLGVLGAAVALYGVFVVVERFAVEPLMPIDLFRNQVFAADALLAFATGMVLLALVYYLPLFLQGVLGESAANAGLVITPLTISLVSGAAVTGALISRLQRYQALTIIGGLILTLGIWLLSRMTAATSLGDATRAMIIAGVGLGMFFPVLTLAVQNALPRARMGVGTGAITYLRALGQTVGLAIVGTIVNQTLNRDVLPQVPAATRQQLSVQALHFATNPQVLVNPTFRDTVIHTAQGFAVRTAVIRATAGLPPGQPRDTITQQVTAQAMQQTVQLLDQVFTAVKHGLATGIERGFIAMLCCCGVIIVATLLLKDVPLARHFQEEAAAAPTVEIAHDGLS